MQQTGWPANFNDLRLSADVQLDPHAIDAKETPNFTVENVVAPRRVYDAKKTRVLATVAGFGNQKADAQRLADAQRPRDRDQAGGGAGERARHRGIPLARRALRPQ